MDSHQPSFIVEGTPLAPTVHIVLPPELQEDAKALAAENVHPAWSKGHRRGRHFVITTNVLDDISELADYARVGIEEPEPDLSKRKRQALQILLDRANRHAVLEPMGVCHCIATEWRDKPLPSHKAAYKTTLELRNRSGSIKNYNKA